VFLVAAKTRIEDCYIVFITMKLSQILFENIDTKELKIISLEGCEDDSFEIDLANGEVKDCTDISAELERLFADSKVRIMSNENPYCAMIDGEGKVYGGLVVSYELPDDFDEFEHGAGVVTFSVVVVPEARRQGVARKLIRYLMNNKPRALIQAQVINRAMVNILEDLGFQKTSESGSREGLVYQLNRK
jgi:ribosomal protein S18 acetylase RimI-like enzyme